MREFHALNLYNHLALKRRNFAKLSLYDLEPEHNGLLYSVCVTEPLYSKNAAELPEVERLIGFRFCRILTFSLILSPSSGNLPIRSGPLSVRLDPHSVRNGPAWTDFSRSGPVQHSAVCFGPKCQQQEETVLHCSHKTIVRQHQMSE